MRKTFLIAILILLAPVFIGCEREGDRPIPATGGQAALNVDKEVQFLNNLVKNDSRNLQAWIKLGNTTMDAQRFTEAVEAYGKALEIDPANADVRVDRGICYRRIGRSDLAVEHFEKALEYQPNHLNAHKNLGVVLGYDMQKFDEAADHFQQYLNIVPAAPDRQQIEQVIQQFRQAAAQHPQGTRTTP